jgi:lipoate-protein ligase A
MFTEPNPDLIAENPGGPDDPLGESVLDPAQPWLRVFAPRDVRVVIGRHQDPAREVHLDHARADGVPVHRRASGGGAVVLAPGMVVVAVRLRPGPVPGRPDPAPPFAISGGWPGLVNHVISAAISDVTGIAPTVRGLGDLAISDGGGERKILGSSLRQTARLVAYLGVLLIDDATALMDRLLASPSREPDYRGGRDHGRFCTHLSRLGATVPAVVDALEQHLARDLDPWAAH